MHDGMQYDSIHCQGQGRASPWKSAIRPMIFRGYLLNL